MRKTLVRPLRTILDQYEAHYTGAALIAAASSAHPRPGHPPVDLFQERIQRRPVLDGLISEYERVT